MGKKRKSSGVTRFFLLLLCMMLLQGVAASVNPSGHVQAATVKKGLKKEGKYYYYYVNNRKVKNTWKTVKVTTGGKTVSYRYYFGSNGRAYAAPNLKKTEGYTKNVVCKKIGKYYYGFDNQGRMVKSGYYCDPNKFDSNGDTRSYYFDKNGRYISSKSKAARKAGAYGAKASTLKKVLGKPLSVKKLNSCFGEPGDDYQWNYKNIYVTVHIYPDGTGMVFGILPR